MSERLDSSGTFALAEIADELGCYKSTLFKICTRLGIPTRKVRDAARRNQLVSVVDHTDAERIRAEYRDTTRAGNQTSGDGETSCGEDGRFYIIELEPEFDPGRFKVGFTTDLDGRLRHHQCAAPFASVLRDWPCRRTWERAAIDCLTSGIEQLHTEVFRTKTFDEVLDRGERFFNLMPPVRDIGEANDDEAVASIQDTD